MREAEDRDNHARDRDLDAVGRDESARRRDRRVDRRECDDAAAQDRHAAAVDRQLAVCDREAAARDREAAARDRLAAQKVCNALLEQLAIAETDQLTGARTRAAGLADIDHEISRAHRTHERLVAVYVDIVGLKLVNDAHGHFAGDAQIAAVAREIRAHLRPYDMIVRLGGDEFLCAMPGATIRDARERFSSIQTALAGHPNPSQIKYGFAELGHNDKTADLIGRADAELPVSAPRPQPTGIQTVDPAP